MSWNVRGLNDKKKRSIVRKEIQTQKPHLVCLQETKWEDENMGFIKETLGGKYTSYVLLSARQTAGGIMIAWDENLLTKIDTERGQFSLTVDMVLEMDNSVDRKSVV